MEAVAVTVWLVCDDIGDAFEMLPHKSFVALLERPAAYHLKVPGAVSMREIIRGDSSGEEGFPIR